MTAKQTRFIVIVAGLGFLALAAWLALSALEDNILFFRSPSALAQHPAPIGQPLRVGGLVKSGSVVHDAENPLKINFIISDLAHEISVSYHGMLPDLFREGQGVVTEGRFVATGGGRVFVADVVLAKHDETYMPPEVAEALKASGLYRPNGKYFDKTSSAGMDE